MFCQKFRKLFKLLKAWSEVTQGVHVGSRLTYRQNSCIGVYSHFKFKSNLKCMLIQNFRLDIWVGFPLWMSVNKSSSLLSGLLLLSIIGNCQTMDSCLIQLLHSFHAKHGSRSMLALSVFASGLVSQRCRTPWSHTQHACVSCSHHGCHIPIPSLCPR